MFQDSISIAVRMIKPQNLLKKKTKTKQRRFQPKMEKKIILLTQEMDSLRIKLRTVNQCGKPSEYFSFDIL